MTINLITNPKEFFYEELNLVLSKQNRSLDDDIHFYLVNLLCDFIELSSLTIDQSDKTVLDKPLALMLAQALEAPPSRKLKIYKRLGDTSLFMAGFFQDFFNRKCFDSEYFIDLGRTAYDRMSDIFEKHYHDENFMRLFNNLAQNLDDLVEIVACVSDNQEKINDPKNLLSLYERWTKNGSERLKQTLIENGIIPVQVAVKKAQ